MKVSGFGRADDVAFSEVDWGAILAVRSVDLAAGAVLSGPIPVGFSMLAVTILPEGVACVYSIFGSSFVSALPIGSDRFSSTKDAPGFLNVYIEAGAVQIQNLLGAPCTLRNVLVTEGV